MIKRTDIDKKDICGNNTVLLLLIHYRDKKQIVVESLN